MSILTDFVLCTLATAFFAVLFMVPKKALPTCAVLGGVGYAVYDVCLFALHSGMAGYFLGTLCIAVCAEILARVFRKPATVFVIAALVPLVPGMGLYNTMMDLVQGQNAKAAGTGASTLLAIIAMAMALVLTSLFFSGVLHLHGMANHKRKAGR